MTIHYTTNSDNFSTTPGQGYSANTLAKVGDTHFVITAVGTSGEITAPEITMRDKVATTVEASFNVEAIRSTAATAYTTVNYDGTVNSFGHRLTNVGAVSRVSKALGYSDWILLESKWSNSYITGAPSGELFGIYDRNGLLVRSIPQTRSTRVAAVFTFSSNANHAVAYSSSGSNHYVDILSWDGSQYVVFSDLEPLELFGKTFGGIQKIDVWNYSLVVSYRTFDANSNSSQIIVVYGKVHDGWVRKFDISLHSDDIPSFTCMGKTFEPDPYAGANLKFERLSSDGNKVIISGRWIRPTPSGGWTVRYDGPCIFDISSGVLVNTFAWFVNEHDASSTSNKTAEGWTVSGDFRRIVYWIQTMGSPAEVKLVVVPAGTWDRYPVVGSFASITGLVDTSYGLKGTTTPEMKFLGSPPMYQSFNTTLSGTITASSKYSSSNFSSSNMSVTNTVVWDEIQQPTEKAVLYTGEWEISHVIPNHGGRYINETTLTLEGGAFSRPCAVLKAKGNSEGVVNMFTPEGGDGGSGYTHLDPATEVPGAMTPLIVGE